MKTDFDQEMDSLLRREARRERVASVERGTSPFAREDDDAPASQSGAHLDADELNAYAENALPAAARAHYAAHLADCDSCRHIVTQVALAAGIPAQLEKREAATENIVTGVSWRERFGALLAPRAWRYVVPSLALLLVGAVVLVVLTRNGSREASVASRRNSQAARPAAAQPETHHTPPNDNAVAATSTERSPDAQDSSASEGKERLAADTTREQTARARTDNIAPAAPPSASVVDGMSASGAAVPEPTPAPAEVGELRIDPEAKTKAALPADNRAKMAEKPAGVESSQRDEINIARQPETARSGRGTRADNSSDVTNETRARGGSVQPAPPPPPADAAQRARPRRADSDEDERTRTERSSKKDDPRAQSAAATRTVAGRQFRREGGAWVDIAYNSSQAVTIVRRNSEQYRALVADEPELRRIADALGGEVTIVWKGRAYRIR